MQTLSEWLDEQEKLCEQATEGPWWSESGTIHCKAPEWTEDCHRCIHPGYFEKDEDGHFAGDARTSLPIALRIIRAIIEDERFDDPDRQAMMSIAERVLEEQDHAE